MRVRPALPLLLALGCAHSPPPLVTGLDPVATRIVFSDIAVFVGADASAAVPHQDVWVQADHIEWVGPTGQKPVPPAATVVPGVGLTLLPGLIDMHVHAEAGVAPPWDLRLPDPDRNLQAYLFSGITTAVDLGGETKRITRMRDDLASHHALGPHLLVAGPVFTAVGGHPVALVNAVVPWPFSAIAMHGLAEEVSTPAEADKALDALLPYQPDVIKLACDEMPVGAPEIDAAVAVEIVKRAHAAGLKAVAHIGGNADMTRMLDAGVDIFVHDVYREKLSDDVAERLGKAGVPVAPTLAVFDEIDRLAFNDLTYSPFTVQVADPRILGALTHRPASFTIPASFQGWLDEAHANRQVKFDNVATLRKHGVTLLAGSDSANVGNFPGAAFHTELADLVQAGLTPAEALFAATGTNAKVFGLADRVGSITPGKRADLLVVRGDPTSDIKAIDAIDSVYLDGQRVQRSQ